MKNYQVETRLLFADLLKIIFVFGVIISHISGAQVKLLQHGSLYWWFANLYNTMGRPAVPIFVMISGMFLLDASKRDDMKTFWTKRFNKVIIPFIFWPIFYYFWMIYYRKPGNFIFYDFVKVIIKGNTTLRENEHLWFLAMIIGIYLSAPIIKKFTDNASNKLQLYFLLVWFVFVSIKPALHKFMGLDIGIYNTIFVNYIGYFVLGHYLHNIKLIHTKTILTILSFIYVASLVTSCIGNYYINLHTTKYDQYFIDNFSPGIVLMSLSIFLIFKILCNKINIKNKFIESYSYLVFGIYLIHIIVLRYIDSSGLVYKYFRPLFANPIVFIPSLAFFGMVISSFIILLMQNIPIIKRVVPK